MRTSVIIWLGLSLTAFSGCSTSRDVVVEQQFVPAKIPEQLLAPIAPVYKPVVSNAGLVDQLTATRGSRAVCVAQLDGIRQWQNEQLDLFPPAPGGPAAKKGKP